jgi:hypothetical protein
MAQSIFDKFDSQIDTKGLAEEVKESEKNGSATFKTVPTGDYEVEVNKMELGLTKAKDKMMLSVWFKVLNGEQKGGMVFMNQVVMESFQIHIANDVLRALTAELPEAMDISFDTYAQYNDLVMDVFEAIEGKYEYALAYGENKKGYPTYEIKEVFVLD